jgi:Sec-independent protein secretion pathway component TatC
VVIPLMGLYEFSIWISQRVHRQQTVDLAG